MRKILLYLLLAGTMLGLCGCGSAEEDEKTTESHVDSLLTIGGQQKYYKELTPEVINVDVEPLTREDVIDIFSDEVMEAVIDFMESENRSYDFMIEAGMTDSNPCRSIIEDGGFYVSTVPCQAFSGTKDKFEEPLLFAFGKDMNFISTISITDNNVCTDMSFVELFDYLGKELFMENPETKYVVVYNPHMCYIDENNVTYIHQLEEWTISGDVFGKLSDFAISYNEITSPDNLIWIDITR